GFGIAKFTETRGWSWGGGRDGFEFAGLRSDVEFATWLTMSLMQFALGAHQLEELASCTSVHKRDFIRGLCHSLRERLLEEVSKRTDARSTGRDLVTVKRPMIEDFLKREGIFLTKGRSRAVAYSSAATAGASWASRAGFGRPVRSSTARIGKA
ncbi:MAG: hypothetical protein L0241_30625, partial [Planctomycetia bacterium]|nr:hypothetical protein [Planctomycetia bacterium]